jgi:hypothetical protein
MLENTHNPIAIHARLFATADLRVSPLGHLCILGTSEIRARRYVQVHTSIYTLKDTLHERNTQQKYTLKDMRSTIQKYTPEDMRSTHNKNTRLKICVPRYKNTRLKICVPMARSSAQSCTRKNTCTINHPDKAQ